MTHLPTDSPLLLRIAEALERLSPAPAPRVDIDAYDAFLWSGEQKGLLPVKEVQHIPLALLQGIDPVATLLLQNTLQFAKGFPANNALLWGARGMGKSSLIKAAHAEINKTATEKRASGEIGSNCSENEGFRISEHSVHEVREHQNTENHPLQHHFIQSHQKLALVEIYREELASLTTLLHLLKDSKRRFILFCDDLSFQTDDASYKSLKAILDGGIEGRPANVLFYATSNRRHLMPREMIDNEQGSAIHPGESVEEKLSLSDRFGLWLGFHSCSHEIYLEMIDRYSDHFSLAIKRDELHRLANEWSITRGARSGRVAWQFIQDIAGKLEKQI